MEYDFQIASNSNVSFSQLFVARSTRLCKYVENAVKGSTRNEEVPGRKRSFTTFKRLIQSLERVTPACHREGAKHFLPSQYIDFHRFKRDLWKPNMGVDALIAWASIRSFIKGSIDAVQKRKHLDKDAYFSLGKKRCRLTMAQRKAVYDVYLKYEKYREELGLWDDCDRVQSLLVGLKELEQTDSLSFYQMQYNKIYVDEVQDYTQAEIALFFCLCGPGGLFLAGDPAQSVVEGVEFRFEEVRSVGHCLYNQDKKLIPDKPKTVNVNFRSHSGILNVAAGVLGQLFKAFPDAAKQLKKDRGLFLGPRPSVLHKVELHIVRDLIAKLDGLVILTHDNAMENLKQQLDYPLVYGIREAKGLEFQSVLLLDFFCRLPTVIQKPFRDLLLGRRIDDLNSTCPEMEGYLKLLYTGITRCIQRLVFAETKRSIAGDAFVRWITTTKDERGRRDSLAVHQGVDDLEVMSRTPDEWRASGLEHAIVAENATDAGQTLSWLEKAIFAFEKAGDKDLSRKARAHKVSALLRGEIDRQRVLKEEKLDVVVQLEVEVAQAVTNLLATGLLFEAKYILEAMLPLLAEYTREKLQTEVILRFPSMEQGKNEEID